MFHDIRDTDKTLFPRRYNLKSFLNKEQFLRQLDSINNRYEVVSSLEAPNLDLTKGCTDYAVLTFDDGLVDHYYVHHHLRDLNLSGTFLVPSAPVLDQHMIHSHKIQFILAAVDEKILTKDILKNFANANDLWLKYTETDCASNWWSDEMIFITNCLRKHKGPGFNNYEYTDFLFQKYVAADIESFSRDFYLTELNLDEMSNNNMVIGGHGHSSENLLLVDNIEAEVKKSYNFVNQYSSNFIFSYPNGGFNDEIKTVMKKYSCEVGYTVKPMTITGLDVLDKLEFPRYNSPELLKKN